MTETDRSDDPQRRITERLRRAGWQREEAAENFDWPDFQFRNGDLTIEFFYPPDGDWVSIRLLAPGQEGELKVAFGERLDEVLDLVVAVQSKLDADYWELFIEELLAAPVRVWAVSGEDSEDIVELRSLKPDSS